MPGRLPDGRINLPGYGAPVNWMDERVDWKRHMFNRCPNALQEWAPEPITVREKNMMQLVNSITDKPEWRRKVFDEAIVEKWRAEAITNEGQGFTENMFDYVSSINPFSILSANTQKCVAELQDKAKKHVENDLTAVLDSQWAVVKSDHIISAVLKEELKIAVAPLENVPESQRDWHPGSDEQVLDLLHPSLFPLIYGRSRILPTDTINLDSCIRASGEGEVVPAPIEHDCKLGEKTSWRSLRGQGATDYWSSRFQWLPSNVSFTDSEGVKITSYINNLHPVHHKALYPVIEKFIVKSIPAWELVLSSYMSWIPIEDLRVPMTKTKYEFPNGEEVPKEVGQEFTEDEDEYWELRDQWVSRVLSVYEGRARPTKELDAALERLGCSRANGGLARWVSHFRFWRVLRCPA